MELKKRLQEQTTLLPILAVLLGLYLYFYGTSDSENTSGEATAEILRFENHQPLQNRADLQAEMVNLNIDDKVLETNINRYFEEGEFKKARGELLELAAEAAVDNDKSALSQILLLLGEVAIDELSLDNAEVYLNEALEIALQSGDEKTTAHCYMQLGRLYTKTRSLARTASNAYDALWITRSQIYQGDYRTVEENLDKLIETNLSIRRYGAAASAYETLADFHLKFHDNYQAQIAAGEAAKLYASAGQVSQAREVIKGLEAKGFSRAQLATLNDELNDLYGQNDINLMETSKAKDYQMLYHYYRTNGETEKAWNLRVQANRSLAKTNEYSMYQRQADVLAILYNSTFSMDKAEGYLGQASEMFAGQGENELLASTQEMRGLIY